MECIGLGPDDFGSGAWSCPHHACAACNMKATAAGGLLFRCEMCSNAFCEGALCCFLLSVVVFCCRFLLSVVCCLFFIHARAHRSSVFLCCHTVDADHLPSEHVIVNKCERFIELGQRHPKTACFIHCDNKVSLLYRYR